MHDEEIRTLPPLETPSRYRTGRVAAWSVAVVLLAAGAFCGYKYGYPWLENNRTWLAQMPGMQQSVAALSRRVDTAEERWRSWAAERDSFAARMTKLERQVRGSAQLARTQTQELAAQTERRLRADLDSRTTAMQARLEQIEANQESDRARLASVQQEVSGVRREVGRQLASAHEDASRSFARVDQRVSALDQNVSRSRDDLDVLSHRFDRKRVDFEVAKNHSREIAPGITLAVTRADPAYRRVNGWMWLMPDRRTVWVRSQGAGQPLVFYSKADERPQELVITHVTRNSVAGYLLVPAGPPPANALAAENSAPRPTAAQ